LVEPLPYVEPPGEVARLVSRDVVSVEVLLELAGVEVELLEEPAPYAESVVEVEPADP
jgi:hypothetical protein